MGGYFTAETSHLKLYVTHNDGAIVGSSNLTKSGLSTTQEINLRIEAEDPAFQHREAVFDGYSAEADPLSSRWRRTGAEKHGISGNREAFFCRL